MRSRSHSIALFQSFLRRDSNGEILDATGINSRECYLAWLASQGRVESDGEAKKFQRTLSNHCAGVDGRTPFDLRAEAAILKVLRKKVRWPCFPDHLSIGRTGFRSRGYHEKLACPTTGDNIRIATPSSPPLLDQPLQGNAAGFKLAETAQRLASTFPKFDRQVWITICDFLRMALYATTPMCSIKSVAEEYAKDLGMVEEMLNPTAAITVVDITAKHHANCYVFQNRESVSLLGNLQQTATREMVHKDDLFKVMCGFASAYYSPGTVYTAKRARYYTVNGNLVMVDVDYKIDSKSYYLVLATTCSVEGV